MDDFLFMVEAAAGKLISENTSLDMRTKQTPEECFHAKVSPNPVEKDDLKMRVEMFLPMELLASRR